MLISARQIKAARQLLDWSQDTLAYSAGVGITTLRTLEAGSIPRCETMQKVRITMESAGIEFTENEGVRIRDRDIKHYRGAEGCEKLFQDILQITVEQGGEIVASVKSQDMLLKLLGVPEGSQDKLERLGKITKMKCLLSEVSTPLAFPPSFQFRTIHKNYTGPYCYFVFGDQSARVLVEGNGSFLIDLYRSSSVAHTISTHFLSLWEMAMPLMMQVGPQEKQRVRA